MSGHIDQARLHDFVEGLLTEDVTREVEAHMAACEACTVRIEGLRSLLSELGALPDEAVPSRDLWSGVRSRMEDRDEATIAEAAPLAEKRPGRMRRVSFSVGQLVAASVVLAVLSGGSVWMALYGGPGIDVPTDVATSDGARFVNVLPAILAATTEYEQAIASLESVLERGRSLLAAETVATIEASLEAIDRAIEDARRALESDPNSDLLNRLLIKNQQSKLRVLRQVVAAVRM